VFPFCPVENGVTHHKINYQLIFFRDVIDCWLEIDLVTMELKGLFSGNLVINVI
jgi:hypothetical protein